MKPPCKTGAIIKCFVSNPNGGHFSICSLLDCKWFTLPFGFTNRSGAFLNPYFYFNNHLEALLLL